MKNSDSIETPVLESHGCKTVGLNRRLRMFTSSKSISRLILRVCTSHANHLDKCIHSPAVMLAPQRDADKDLLVVGQVAGMKLQTFERPSNLASLCDMTASHRTGASRCESVKMPELKAFE